MRREENRGGPYPAAKVFNHSNVGITYVYIGIRNDEINDFYKNIKYRDDD